jgi:glycosyltransferase involved in cell wall biosynthesis
MSIENSGHPKISIAMATYNGQRFLLRQINSIFKQTYLPQEICISDDASKDETLTVLSQIKAEVPIKLHTNKVNVGLIDNFKNALSLVCNLIGTSAFI